MKNNCLKKVCCLAVVMTTIVFASCGGSTSGEVGENPDTSEQKARAVISKQIQYNYESGTVMAVTEYEYDKEGVRTQTIQKDAEGNIIATIKPEYNEDGKIAKEVTTDIEGNVTAVQEYVYEDDKHYTITYSDAEENILYAHKYEYDDKGGLIKLEMDLGNAVNVFSYENEYDGDKLVKAINFYQDEENGYVEYTYDEYGNSLKTTSYNSDGTVVSYTEYVCDADGNMSSSKTYTFDKLTMEVEYIVIK